MKKNQRLLLIFLCSVLLAGCTTGIMPEGSAGVQQNSELPAIQEDGNREDTAGEEVQASVVEKIPGIVPQDVQELRQQQKGLFYYEQLSEDEQLLYAEILKILQDFGEETALSCLEPDTIESVFQYVLNDHPEIFYVDGYSATSYGKGQAIVKMTFTGGYTMDADTVQERNRLIEQYVVECFDQMDTTLDEYGKVKYIYEYLIDQTEYDLDAMENQNICSVFIYKRSVCMGYARATQYLLQRAGIDATIIQGQVSGGEAHAWNMVKVDGDYYYVDTTWGDASYQLMEGSQPVLQESVPPINYDYLCVTTNQLQRTHLIGRDVSVPLCDATRDNYYVREGLYFTQVDQGKLSELFQAAYEQGSSYVTLKCADANVYEEMWKYLIEEQGIFTYMNVENGAISYSNSDAQYSLSFWL